MSSPILETTMPHPLGASRRPFCCVRYSGGALCIMPTLGPTGWAFRRMAADEVTAMEKAAAEYKVPENRLMAIRR